MSSKDRSMPSSVATVTPAPGMATPPGVINSWVNSASQSSLCGSEQVTVMHCVAVQVASSGSVAVRQTSWFPGVKPRLMKEAVARAKGLPSKDHWRRASLGGATKAKLQSPSSSAEPKAAVTSQGASSATPSLMQRSSSQSSCPPMVRTSTSPIRVMRPVYP